MLAGCWGARMPVETRSSMDALAPAARRVHTAITAEIEKRVLIWMACRMPGAIGPDHLTGLAIVSMFGAGVLYAVSARAPKALWMVNVFLLLNWLGDSLDGTLARVRQQQRPRYGFYVDHICDMIGALALMGGLAWSGLAAWQIAAGMLVSFYALSIESYLAAYSLGRFHVSHGPFGPTEVRILLLVANAAAAARPIVEVAHKRFLLFDIGGAAAIGAMAILFLAAAIRHTAVLYREERLP